jgi:hypothetical protein
MTLNRESEMKWRKDDSRLYWHYDSQAVRIIDFYSKDYNHLIGFGKVWHHNGPKWAYAQVWIMVCWPTDINSHWGHELSRHFYGYNATRKAMRWVELMLSEDVRPMYVNYADKPSADWYREFGIGVGEMNGSPTIQRTIKQLPLLNKQEVSND